ncbi:hypothetical protein [Verminephrobacter eiseniae]|uniref:hypothetical protein n=1 Tax=Verminephrobacter eiseniae TaxID=364317 RepID=UPI0012EE3A5F|nr:hypothetical protein [Verminephrobacter eiseniae]
MQFIERRGRRPFFSLRAIRGAVQIDMDSQGQIADASHAYLSGTTSKRPEPSQVVSQPVGMGSLQSLGTDRRCP